MRSFPWIIRLALASVALFCLTFTGCGPGPVVWKLGDGMAVHAAPPPRSEVPK